MMKGILDTLWRKKTFKMASTVLMVLIALCLYSGFAGIVAAETTNDNPLPSFDQWFNPSEIDGTVLKSNATTYIYAMLSNEKMVAPDKTWELSHPGLVIYDDSQKVITSTSRLENSQFVSNNRINATFSVTRQPIINKLNVSETSANTSSTDGTAGAAALSPVYIYSVSYNWYWVQDTWFNNEVTIYNAGPAIASGRVIFISPEDGYGYYATYSNLAPYTFATVTIPFEVIGSLSTVGIKPIIIQVRVDPNDEVTDAIEMPVSSIEKYNNDANHLADPDGGDSLESSDLYHPLNDGYTILQEAATACDNTISPYMTAFIGNVYVNYIFNYSDVSPLEQYTAADLYIKNHMLNGKYQGVCDEFATMYTSFMRALGVPTRYYVMTFDNSTGYTFGHGITEVWDGSRWVHSDPTWKQFDNSHIYNQSGFSSVKMWHMSDANDNIDTTDPSGDQLLNSWEDFGIIRYLGERPEYN